MSASRFTDWAISCDHTGGCNQAFMASELTGADCTATNGRIVLRDRGWTVAVPQPSPDGGREKRLDFCPAHKPVDAI